MPISPVGSSGDDTWGRRTSAGHSTGTTPQPSLPDADPDGMYRPAAVGGHRTARWFILIGAVIVILCIPLAVPSNPSGSAGLYSSHRMNDAAADSLMGWGAAPVDLSGLDNRCAPDGDVIMPGLLEAVCAPAGEDRDEGFHGFGATNVDLELTSMVGVSDVQLSSQRSLRAILASDTAERAGIDFTPADAHEILHPSLADGELLFTPVITLREGAGDSYLDPPADPRDRVEQPEFSPVQYQHGGGGVFAVAASFTAGPADDVLYTVLFSGTNPHTITHTANSLLGEIRA